MARKKRRGSGDRRGLVIGLAIAALLLAVLIVWLVIKLIGSIHSDLSGTTVRVPELVDLSEAQAIEKLNAAQLKPRQALRQYNDKVETGHIYQQDPEPGLMVRPGATVRYYVSLGKASFTVPDLTGKTPDEAAEALRKSGLALGAVQRIYDANNPAGRIINQSPHLGEEFTSPVNVDVVVADTHDLPQVAIPDFVGQPLTSAEETLTRSDLNLHLAVVEYVEDNTNPPGTVLAQKPVAGEQVNMASRVELQVAMPSDVKNNPHKRLTIHIPVPIGPPEQKVVIKVSDELGERIDFTETKKPGEIVERTVEVEGSAKVKIFVGDDKEPLREERI
jgi:serine/threonine-protein kinase